MPSRYRGFDRDERSRIVEALLERDGANCLLCDGPLDLTVAEERHPQLVTIDHMHPLGDGGDYGAHDRLENLQLTHLLCNNKRAQFGDHRLTWFARQLALALSNWPKPSKRDRKLAKRARDLDHMEVV